MFCRALPPRRFDCLIFPVNYAERDRLSQVVCIIAVVRSIVKIGSFSFSQESGNETHEALHNLHTSMRSWSHRQSGSPDKQEPTLRQVGSHNGQLRLGVRDSNPPIRIQSPLSCRLDEPPALTTPIVPCLHRCDKADQDLTANQSWVQCFPIMLWRRPSPDG